MERRLIAAIACRNQGSRLYGKPLQNLDIHGQVRIIDNIVECLRTLDCINEIVFGISEGIENEIYKQIAEEKNLRYIVGDQEDVLSRLIECGKFTRATDIFRVTSESPYLYFEEVADLWNLHKAEVLDATFMDEVIDGCGFEIIRQSALETSHHNGDQRHRSELCSLYIRENITQFKVYQAPAPTRLKRRDLRLTVDNPEDLALCRVVYGELKHLAPRIPISTIAAYLDSNPKLIELCSPYVESGYLTVERYPGALKRV